MLDIVALVAFLCLYWLSRTGYARDPVCGMRVELKHAAVDEYRGRRVYFCSEACKARFDKGSERSLKASK